MRNATFRQLRVFNEVARHLSFAKAAQALHLTPPAVTMQIKELEGHVGMPLFERSGRQVALTTVGEYMLVYARKMLATLKDAEDTAARLQKLEVGTLTIGMVSTAKYFLPHLLTEFRREHEGIEIKLAAGNREQLVQMLHANEVDIAIMGRPPKELATRAEPFAAHPHVFVTPVGHPLANAGHLPVEALHGQSFIVREQGSGTRAALEKFLKEAHVELRITMEMASNETIKQAVMAGMGLSFLSLHTLGLELDHGLIALPDVEGAPVVRAWNVVNTLSKLLSPAAEAFRYFVLERGESFLAEHFRQHVDLAELATDPLTPGPFRRGKTNMPMKVMKAQE
ncbi:MAG: LysR family transcriptional regulator [Hydrogenophaga sp.]|jgi:DNA-binding transcriptional LysR family regulator|uniref:LysR family transcriptional regulator n=1 Tax=Comamonadaceae TaxID=80864 RepID=UPI0025BB41BE|nr:MULTISPECIES: LysR family transcriptional regulator [Comamonadaceae]MDZ4283032.1 LysR family transcriptional regulator [Hydrogenophaga sp.]